MDLFCQSRFGVSSLPFFQLTRTSFSVCNPSKDGKGNQFAPCSNNPKCTASRLIKYGSKEIVVLLAEHYLVHVRACTKT